MTTEDPGAAADTATPGRRQFRWVTPLAIINVVWLVVGLLLLSSDTWLAVIGMVMLPQVIFVITRPLTVQAIAVIVPVAVLIVSVFTGARTGTIGYRLWAFGNLALTLFLLASVLTFFGAASGSP